jgi:CheY-like chemotaxis protein
MSLGGINADRIPSRMAANNTILIVDDDPEKLAYYWRLFEEDAGARFDVLGEGRPQRHRLLCHRLGDSFRFVEMFAEMHRMDHHFPLCIVDMRMPGSDGLIDELRGLAVSRRVREIDPVVHIVLATAKADVDDEEVCREVGGSTHFFRLPFGAAQEEAFVAKVHALVDDWNERR